MGTANAKRGRARMVCAGLVLFLVITAGGGRPPEQSSAGTAFIGLISTLARFPAVLRLFVMATISAGPDEKVGR
jgi:hypothetical protein